MKNLVSKLLPLVQKLKGKKPIVVLLSALVIGGYFIAIKKGYIQEGSLDLDTVVNYLDSTFKDNSVDTVKSTVDSVLVK